MRLLHTSDWHLGRRLHGVDLLDHQRQVLEALVDDVRTRSVDVVVVAGDVYDRALPPVDAVRLYDDVVTALARTDAVVLITSGNHDSPQRLGVNAGLLPQAGVHLRCSVDGAAEPVVVDDGHGPVALFGLPFLEPAAVAEALGVERPTHAEVTAAALDRVRDWLDRHPGHRSVVAAHAFVTGGPVGAAAADGAERSDSERALAVGGAEHVPVGVLDGVDYVALGHLHGPQHPGGHSRVAYSGSPLAYSFSESRQRKGWWLVDLDSAGAVTPTWRPAPVPRAMARLRGRLDVLLADRSLAEAEDAWVDVVLTDPQRPADAMRRVQERFAHALQLRWEPDGAGDGPGPTYAERVRGLEPLEVSRSFVTHVRGRDADDAETDLLARALDAGRLAVDAPEAGPGPAAPAVGRRGHPSATEVEAPR